jgi:hypothetical protein
MTNNVEFRPEQIELRSTIPGAQLAGETPGQVAADIINFVYELNNPSEGEGRPHHHVASDTHVTVYLGEEGTSYGSLYGFREIEDRDKRGMHLFLGRTIAAGGLNGILAKETLKAFNVDERIRGLDGRYVTAITGGTALLLAGIARFTARRAMEDPRRISSLAPVALGTIAAANYAGPIAGKMVYRNIITDPRFHHLSLALMAERVSHLGLEPIINFNQSSVNYPPNGQPPEALLEAENTC